MQHTTLLISPDKPVDRIAPEIYGQFSEHLGRCIYDGIYVGEDSEIPNTRGIRNDVVEALRQIQVPVLRWPGGNFSDEYHWMDGIGPKAQRRRMVNTSWGGVVEDNRFGTHEFMDLCEQIGCEPYIALNLGSGTVREAAEWIEYLTADGDSSLVALREQNGRKKPWKVRYIGIGNESWGSGGSMEPEYYANEYRRYQQFCKNYGDNELYKVAVGPDGADYHWTKELMRRINHWHANAISLHYYTLPGEWEHKGSATDFTEKEYYITLQKTWRMQEIIEEHLKIMNECDPEHAIDLIVDEWGTWYDVEPGTHPGFLYQQNTMRDAVVAAINLNIFNRHCERVKMANIAQVVNVLQAMLLTKGNQLVKTPTYAVFEMFRTHQGATLVQSEMDPLETGMENIRLPMLSESVSIRREGIGKGRQLDMTITLSNASLEEEAEVAVKLPEGYAFAGRAGISVLSGEMNAHNTFDNPDCVISGTESRQWSGTKQIVSLPVCSVVAVRCRIEKINGKEVEKR